MPVKISYLLGVPPDKYPAPGLLPFDAVKQGGGTLIYFSSKATLAVDLLLTTCAAGSCDMASAPHPFQSILKQAVAAMGFAPPLPQVASGFIQSKDRYGKGQRPTEVAATDV